MLSKLFMAGVLLVGTATIAAPASPSSVQCSAAQIAAGLCPPPPTNAGDRVDLEWSLDLGSASAAQPRTDPAVPIGTYPGTGMPSRPTLPPPAPDESTARIVCLDGDSNVVGADCALPVAEPEQAEPEAPQGPPAVVTISDIASFVPAPPAVSTEPDGIGAKNMPLNTVSTSETQTVDGALFGFPVSVTFTPAGFRHDWGDGTVTETSTGGASWSALGQAEYSPTDTSHAYTAKGTYTLNTTAYYRAVVDFGPWGTRTVDGLISAPAASRDIRIVEVRTALVQYDCVEAPSSPGC